MAYDDGAEVKPWPERIAAAIEEAEAWPDRPDFSDGWIGLGLMLVKALWAERRRDDLLRMQSCDAVRAFVEKIEALRP